MGNCLRLGISRVGLAVSKWRMSAKFKRKNVSIIILGMQAVGKSTIALRLYKFKRALPDLNYVQTKGFNTFTVKKNKTTINIYDLGGHPSIQELWDHYYADAHGVIFVVDTSKRETVPEAGQLLSIVLNDYRIRGKPVLLLANKVDLDSVSESELDTMLNLQQLVNSVRCLTRLDVSCATDLKSDKGIFEGFKWLISYIESNYIDLNNRVLSDTLEEKNREKARREAVKAARQQDIDEENAQKVDATNDIAEQVNPEEQNLSAIQADNASLHSSNPNEENLETTQPKPNDGDSEQPNHLKSDLSPSEPTPETNSDLNDVAQKPQSAHKGSKPDPFLLPPVKQKPEGSVPTLPPLNHPFVDQPVKLPRLKSPKSRPEIINRIEDHGNVNFNGTTQGIFRNSYASNGNNGANGNDQYYEEKGFRFRRISAARRLSPEGADSDDGIVNYAYEPTEDLSSDSTTPIGVRKHNFAAEFQPKEILMVTTLAEVHKEYFKDRKGSTSTHDSIPMSITSEATDIADDGQMSTPLKGPQDEKTKESKPTSKGKSKKRFNLKPKNKTAPELPEPSTESLPPVTNQKQQSNDSRTSSAQSKVSRSEQKTPFTVTTVSNAWETEIPETGTAN